MLHMENDWLCNKLRSSELRRGEEGSKFLVVQTRLSRFVALKNQYYQTFIRSARLLVLLLV